MPERLLNIIGAASSAGAYAPGQEQAPAAFRRHGLAEALGSRGRPIRDHGDVVSFRWRLDSARPQAMNLDAVRHACDLVAGPVSGAIAAQENVLVLGGDCTVELGTVAGANAAGARLGLVYISTSMLISTHPEPATAPSIGLAWRICSIFPIASPLASIGPLRPMLSSQQLLYFAVENITPPEAATIKDRTIEVVSLDEALRDIEAATARATEWASRFDCVLIHFDVDVLAFVDFPIAENVRRCKGLTLDCAAFVLKRLTSLPQWRALTITEVNPDHAPDEPVAFSRLNGVLADALG